MVIAAFLYPVCFTILNEKKIEKRKKLILKKFHLEKLIFYKVEEIFYIKT